MLAVADALAIVLAQAAPLLPHRCDLSTAAGHILAAAVQAAEPLPPFPASIKDGYAVIAADGPGDYPVVAEVTAGRTAEGPLQPGTVAYITTGAPVPVGADAVVMVEETNPLPARNGQRYVHIGQQVAAGDDIRPIGADIKAGETVLTAGSYLEAAEIGLLATVGATAVNVYPRPRVAILSTGDELVEPTATPGPGQIRDSNRSMLMAAVAAVGGEPRDLGIAADQSASLRQQLEIGLAHADILLTSGGVSMGELDLIKPLLAEMGTVHFGRILMKPGKPLTFATVPQADGRTSLAFGLPGNPVSSLVTFYLFVAPTIRKLAGWPDPQLRRVQATLSQPLRLDAYRPEYHRATLQWDSSLNDGNGGFRAISTGSQASSRLLSMRTANALLELPQGSETLAAGSVVWALLIGAI
jgi:gephyrin